MMGAGLGESAGCGICRHWRQQELVSQVSLPMLRLPQVVLSLLGVGPVSQAEAGYSTGLVTACQRSGTCWLEPRRGQFPEHSLGVWHRSQELPGSEGAGPGRRGRCSLGRLQPCRLSPIRTHLGAVAAGVSLPILGLSFQVCGMGKGRFTATPLTWEVGVLKAFVSHCGEGLPSWVWGGLSGLILRPKSCCGDGPQVSVSSMGPLGGLYSLESRLCRNCCHGKGQEQRP